MYTQPGKCDLQPMFSRNVVVCLTTTTRNKNKKQTAPHSGEQIHLFPLKNTCLLRTKNQIVRLVINLAQRNTLHPQGHSYHVIGIK